MNSRTETQHERPNVLDVEAVIQHVIETDDVVFCQPPAPGATRFFWGVESGGVYLMHCGKCNYGGNDAVRRFKELQNGRYEMEWRDSSREGVMDYWDDQIRDAEAMHR